MSKGKKSKARQSKIQNNHQNVIIIPENFDYQKFADAMVEAHQRAKEVENREEEKENQKRQAEWEKILGYKEYSISRFKFVNNFYSAINGIKIFWKIMTFKKEEAKFDVATVALLHFSINAMLWLIKVTLYLMSLIFIIASFYSFNDKSVIPFNFTCLLMALIPFVLARIVRMAQFEIEHIKDRNYLIGILSSIAAFIAMILAIIALIV